MMSTPPTVRGAYLDWVEEQIENFKESIPRADLLALAEDVVNNLRVDQEGQYQLTEILLCTAVDRKIFRLLKLPSYQTWRKSRSPGNQPAPLPPAGEGLSAS